MKLFKKLRARRDLLHEIERLKRHHEKELQSANRQLHDKDDALADASGRVNELTISAEALRREAAAVNLRLEQSLLLVRQVREGQGMVFCKNGHGVAFSPPLPEHPVCLGARCPECDEWVRTPAGMQARIDELEKKRSIGRALNLADAIGQVALGLRKLGFDVSRRVTISIAAWASLPDLVVAFDNGEFVLSAHRDHVRRTIHATLRWKIPEQGIDSVATQITPEKDLDQG